VAQARDRTEEYPHIAFRDAEGERESYVLDTGLAVWEIAWLARVYGDDAEAIAGHTLADRSLVEEGLVYAAAHRAEIDAQIAFHTERPLEELRELLPGMRVIAIDSDAAEPPHA
jgi:hypothetical protein